MSEDRSGGHCLLILCGLPASGKTRLAKSILDQCIQVGHETNENTCNGMYAAQSGRHANRHYVAH